MKNFRKNFVTGGDMDTPVTFYIVKPDDDFMPGESVSEIHYQCFADVYAPSQKDLDMTENKASISMVTWFPMENELTDDMYFEIDLPRYKGKQYNITKIEDDPNNHMNIKIIGERKDT
ncbi:phage head-tail adapter protein [Staphylococcus massiliensis]|uniref:phage head-tail adapter protein n=1 Tax=Staphylococcus massiliensis TaxID=555791 RepID=UPI001EDE0645|nr:phage head-tail adapter protein [Staphylococcus massiliensis]MCG3401692.1 phage head-tail adapter protein [Staphylococcus massiliensis]